MRLARKQLGHLFSYIPKQPGDNKRLRSLAPEISLVIEHHARISPSFCDRIRLLDSTPVPCGQSRETRKRSELAGWAAYGVLRLAFRYFWVTRFNYDWVNSLGANRLSGTVRPTTVYASR